MNEQTTPPLIPHGGLSHVTGPQEPALASQTIPQLLQEAVAKASSREALIFAEQGQRLSYGAFAEAVDALAAGLVALGFAKGDRIGIWSPNRLEWVLTQFATARIGAILVNINPAYRVSELEYALKKVGCSGLILAPEFKGSDYVAMITELVPELAGENTGEISSERLPDLRRVIAMDNGNNENILGLGDVVAGATDEARGALDAITAGLSPDDAINIQFTSGTTGQPKGATLTHRNIVNNARFVTDRIKLTKDDRLAIPVPLYHCFGMVMGVLGAVSKGATMVFPGEGFDAPQTMDVLAREACTAVYGVPTMFVAMLQVLDEKSLDLSRLRTGILAGSTCPVDIMQRVGDDMNMSEVTICYGMTETAPVSFQSFVDDPTDKRCETVGRVHPHLEVKIVDEGGATLPVGQQGELCTRGYSVMQGYWNDPERTAESIRDGWMHTGDLAVIDDEGFCTITGRVKDMIIRGGENIYPREIEEYLFRHPKVAEAQVFGIPDEKFGEVVCAWVVEKPGAGLQADELRAFCVGQIAHHKIPKHFRIVAELPMTITGKPRKFVMRDKMQEMLDQGA